MKLVTLAAGGARRGANRLRRSVSASVRAELNPPQTDTRRKLSLSLWTLHVIILRPMADVEIVTLAGLEPAIFGSEDQHLTH